MEKNRKKVIKSVWAVLGRSKHERVKKRCTDDLEGSKKRKSDEFKEEKKKRWRV